MVKHQRRNLMLVIIASIWITLSAIVVLAGVLNFQTFGWLIATLMIVAGVISVVPAVVAIVKNDPAWLLLDIILPG